MYHVTTRALDRGGVEPRPTVYVRPEGHPLYHCSTGPAAVLRSMRPAQSIRMKFFFLRLPFDHHGPVSELSQSNLYTLCCTGPFNWGDAHCAGEKVKQTNRTISKEVSKLTTKQTKNKQQQPGRSPPRQPGTPQPGSQLHEPRKEQQPTRDFTMRQIKVRLNVH